MIEFRFDTDERGAASEIGISPDTLKGMRIRGDIPPYCYTKFGYKLLRYCLPLLRDWQLDPNDLEAQTRAMEQLQNSRVSNLPTKRGRRTA
jgi:hypothetical protein